MAWNVDSGRGEEGVDFRLEEEISPLCGRACQDLGELGGRLRREIFKRFGMSPG
jgi:hypothetical protein